MKIVVHTKTGKKLQYNSGTFRTLKEANDWWILAFSDTGVSFGRYAMDPKNIDYVEVFP